jgi:hypothetical protein
MGNFAQGMPGGVFETDIVIAVEPVFVVDITERFGRVWMFRGCNRFDVHVVGIIHFASLIIFRFREACTNRNSESKPGRGLRPWCADARAKRKPKRFKPG